MELDVQNTEDGYTVMQRLVRSLGFHKRWRILWLAEQLVGFQ
jgi:hypothetical protein